MRLIALKRIRHSVGQIDEGQDFQVDEHAGLRLIAAGTAATEEDYQRRPWSGRGYWHITPEWNGQTVCIIGGGPSVTQERVRHAKDCRVIAINTSLHLAPYADILYFCDARWYDWHRAAVHSFAGRRVTLENLGLQQYLEVRCLRDYGVEGFAPKSDGVTNGRNSGFQALHLAAWLGAARIVLLGYDMRANDAGDMHWHDEHPLKTPPNIFPNWLSCFGSIAPALQQRGIEVINCSPGSALTVFPFRPIDEALH